MTAPPSSDFEPEEIKSHMSDLVGPGALHGGQGQAQHHRYTRLADFFGEVRAACSVVDLMVLVVSAVDGIEAQTQAAWTLAAKS